MHVHGIMYGKPIMRAFVAVTSVQCTLEDSKTLIFGLPAKASVRVRARSLRSCYDLVLVAFTLDDDPP